MSSISLFSTLPPCSFDFCRAAFFRTRANSLSKRRPLINDAANMPPPIAKKHSPISVSVKKGYISTNSVEMEAVIEYWTETVTEFRNRRRETSGYTNRVNGFSNLRRGGLSTPEPVCHRDRPMIGINAAWIFGGGTLPSPTRARRVSGRKLRTGQQVVRFKILALTGV